MRIWIQIRIQHFFYLWIRIPDPDPGFDDLKFEKIYSWKFNFYFVIKNCNLLIPRPPRTPKLQEKPSALTREHSVLKNMKILDFFLFLWVIFALLDPDPQFECRSGSGSSNSK
jgi:hypothetical protein